MDTREYETKVLNIDPEEIIEKLRDLGAKETAEFLARRWVFDIDSPDIEWIRLRQSGNKTTLCYKYKTRGNTEVGKTIEIEVEVSDFDKTAAILSKLTFRDIYYQENKNHVFHLGDIEFSIDSWPQIDPYLEVESTSIEKVNEGLRKIGLEGKDSGDKDIVEIYKEAGKDIHSTKNLKFD